MRIVMKVKIDFGKAPLLIDMQITDDRQMAHFVAIATPRAFEPELELMGRLDVRVGDITQLPATVNG